MASLEKSRTICMYVYMYMCPEKCSIVIRSLILGIRGRGKRGRGGLREREEDGELGSVKNGVNVC
jgi:hypothetical protein